MLVIACDSLGGIGPKPLDTIKVDGYTVGKFTARVALMEVLSVGAKPVCVVDNLCVERNPTGEEILRGVRAEAVAAGLDPEWAVTGSCEKNFVVQQTGIGITVVGVCGKNTLRIGCSQSNDVVVAIGKPCLGYEVILGECEGSVCTIADLLALQHFNGIHEIIPVGSEGIEREINVLEKSSGLSFQANPNSKCDLSKSAGPATVLLVTLSSSGVAAVEQLFGNKPFEVIGKLL